MPRGRAPNTSCFVHSPCARSLHTPPPTLETWQHLTMAPRQRSKQQAAALSILSLPQDALVNILGRLSLAERCARGWPGDRVPAGRSKWRQRSPLHTAACRRSARPHQSSPSRPCVQAQHRRLCVQELPGCGGGARAAAHRGPQARGQHCGPLPLPVAARARHLATAKPFGYQVAEEVSAFAPLMASALAACTGLTQLRVGSEWPGLGGVSWQQGMTRLRKLSIWARAAQAVVGRDVK